MGDQLTTVLDQECEQAEFGRGQVDLDAAQVRSMIVEVDDHLPVTEPPRPLRRAGSRPAEGRFHAGDELGKDTGFVMYRCP